MPTCSHHYHVHFVREEPVQDWRTGRVLYARRRRVKRTVQATSYAEGLRKALTLVQRSAAPDAHFTLIAAWTRAHGNAHWQQIVTSADTPDTAS